MRTCSISVEKPYSILTHLHIFSPPERPIPCFVYGNEFWRLIPARGEYVPVLAEIHEDEGRIDVIWEMGNSEIIATVRHILATDVSYSLFLRSLKNYPALKEIASRHMGLRPSRNLNLYEALIKVVLQQRISLRIALSTTAKIVEKWGIRKEWNNRIYYSFPPPEKLMKMDVYKIKALGTTTMKAKSLVEIAKNAYDGSLPSIHDADRDSDGTVEELMKIYGVGRWTAELALATVLHDYSVAPAGDLNVMKGFSRFLGIGKEMEIREYTKQFGEWKGLIMYLIALSAESSK